MSAREELTRMLSEATGEGGAGGELSDDAAALLVRGPANATDATAELRALWTDLGAGRELPGKTVAAGLLRTVELAATLPASGAAPEGTAETLGRAFTVLATDDAALADDARTHLRDALLEVTDALAETEGSVEEARLGWVALANSIVAVWPDAVGDAFAMLQTPGEHTWRAAMQYFSVLAYDVDDHPWFRESVTLWGRFGDVQWKDAKGLDAMLDEDPMEEALEGIKALAAKTPETGIVVPLTDEIPTMQYEDEVPTRRAVVRARLTSAFDSDAGWDD